MRTRSFVFPALRHPSHREVRPAGGRSDQRFALVGWRRGLGVELWRRGEFGVEFVEFGSGVELIFEFRSGLEFVLGIGLILDIVIGSRFILDLLVGIGVLLGVELIVGVILEFRGGVQFRRRVEFGLELERPSRCRRRV